MKEYVFYTCEGYTESPTGKPVENIQILGFANGDNHNVALNDLIKRNQWIVEKDFDIHKICFEQLLDNNTKQLIKKLLDYNWEEKKTHYEEYPQYEHILLTIKELKKVIE